MCSQSNNPVGLSSCRTAVVDRAAKPPARLRPALTQALLGISAALQRIGKRQFGPPPRRTFVSQVFLRHLRGFLNGLYLTAEAAKRFILRKAFVRQLSLELPHCGLCISEQPFRVLASGDLLAHSMLLTVKSIAGFALGLVIPMDDGDWYIAMRGKPAWWTVCPFRRGRSWGRFRRGGWSLVQPKSATHLGLCGSEA